VFSLICWKIIDAIIGVRVSAEEEMEGLDVGEHGNIAYPDFVTVGARGASVMDPAGQAVGATEGYRAPELSKGTM
jgi:hypothetical protein